MNAIIAIIPIVLLFVLMLGIKMAGHKSALITLLVTIALALFVGVSPKTQLQAYTLKHIIS